MQGGSLQRNFGQQLWIERFPCSIQPGCVCDGGFFKTWSTLHDILCIDRDSLSRRKFRNTDILLLSSLSIHPSINLFSRTVVNISHGQWDMKHLTIRVAAHLALSHVSFPSLTAGYPICSPSVLHCSLGHHIAQWMEHVTLWLLPLLSEVWGWLEACFIVLLYIYNFLIPCGLFGYVMSCLG